MMLDHVLDLHKRAYICIEVKNIHVLMDIIIIILSMVPWTVKMAALMIVQNVTRTSYRSVFLYVHSLRKGIVFNVP